MYLVEHSASINEELRFIIKDGVGLHISDLEAPFPSLLVPSHAFDLMLELYVLVDEVILIVDAFEILPDLWRVAVVVRPEFDLPGELVVDRRDITGTSRIARYRKVFS